MPILFYLICLPSSSGSQGSEVSPNRCPVPYAQLPLPGAGRGGVYSLALGRHIHSPSLVPQQDTYV